MTDTAVETMKRIAAQSPFNDDTPPSALIESYGRDLGDSVEPGKLDYLERELTAALHALWRVRGVHKKIVKVTYSML